MGPLSTYYKLRTANPQVLSPGETPLMPVNNQGVQQPSAAVQPQQPQVDTSDPINSLAGMLVTPAEREAKQQRLLENKRRMIAWTGLFEGLRQLGNLYYTSKGASPQTYTNNPAQAIEQGYQQELKNLDDIQRNRQAYAQQIWSLRRQASDDARRNALSAAQVRYYDTRDEMARLKGENDRLKAEKQNEVSDARKEQIEQKTKQMKEMHPLQMQNVIARTKSALHNANRPYGSGRGGRTGRSSSSDPYEELATQLNDNPDIIGPILEQEGLGFYNKDTKEFNFTKNVTKGMATTANKRARAAGKSTSSGRRGSLLPGGKSKSTKQRGSLLPR